MWENLTPSKLGLVGFFFEIFVKLRAKEADGLLPPFQLRSVPHGRSPFRKHLRDAVELRSANAAAQFMHGFPLAVVTRWFLFGETFFATKNAPNKCQ